SVAAKQPFNPNSDPSTIGTARDHQVAQRRSPRSDPIQFGPSIGLPTARYSSRTWLAVRYFGRMFSSGVTGTRNHRYSIEGGRAQLSGGDSGARLVRRFR